MADAATNLTDINAALEQLEGWGFDPAEETISKRFTFSDYAEAFTFVTRISLLAEKHNHHPDIAFGWGYATITLKSHDVGAITERDIRMAEDINQA